MQQHRQVAEVLGKAAEFAPDVAKTVAELKVVEAAVSALSKGIKESKSVLAGAFVTVQKASVEASKVLGASYNKEIERTINLYKELSDVEGLAISYDQIKKATFEIGETFKNTGYESEAAMSAIERSVSRTGNVIESSKMVSFIKTFTFQSKAGAKEAAIFAEKMTALADAIGRPPETLVKLSAGLLNANVTFGATEDRVAALTLKTDRFAHSLGVSSDKIKGLLGGMLNIGERQQVAARLSQIGLMVSQQTGADVDVDIQGLLSSDPAVQLRAFRRTLKSLSRAQKDLPEASRRALVEAMMTTKLGSALGRHGMQTAFSSPEKIDALTKAAAERRKPGEDVAGGAGLRGVGVMSPERLREFATLSARMSEKATAKRLALGTKIMKDTFKSVTDRNEKMSDIVGKIDKKLSTAVSDFSVKVGEYTHSLTKVLILHAKSVAATPGEKRRLERELKGEIAKLERQWKADVIAAAAATRAEPVAPAGTAKRRRKK